MDELLIVFFTPHTMPEAATGRQVRSARQRPDRGPSLRSGPRSGRCLAECSRLLASNCPPLRARCSRLLATRQIDPLGVAFDNYDAIGRWRTVETVPAGIGEDPKLDPSGELYDGRKFSDATGLKKILIEDTDKFAAAFTEKLATYALRRGMTFTDRTALRSVTARSKSDNYRIASLIESLVTSELFLKR